MNTGKYFSFGIFLRTFDAKGENCERSFFFFMGFSSPTPIPFFFFCRFFFFFFFFFFCRQNNFKIADQICKSVRHTHGAETCDLPSADAQLSRVPSTGGTSVHCRHRVRTRSSSEKKKGFAERRSSSSIF